MFENSYKHNAEYSYYCGKHTAYGVVSIGYHVVAFAEIKKVERYEGYESGIVVNDDTCLLHTDESDE